MHADSNNAALVVMNIQDTVSSSTPFLNSLHAEQLKTSLNNHLIWKENKLRIFYFTFCEEQVHQHAT